MLLQYADDYGLDSNDSISTLLDRYENYGTVVVESQAEKTGLPRWAIMSAGILIILIFLSIVICISKRTCCKRRHPNGGRKEMQPMNQA